MKNITKILLIVGIVMSGVSCNKFFDDMKPTDKVSDKVIWQTTKNAEYYVNYLYDYVYVVVANQTYGSVMTEAYTDMFKYSSFNAGHPGLFVSQMAYGQPYTERNFVNVYLGGWHSGDPGGEDSHGCDGLRCALLHEALQQSPFGNVRSRNGDSRA